MEWQPDSTVALLAPRLPLAPLSRRADCPQMPISFLWPFLAATILALSAWAARTDSHDCMTRSPQGSSPLIRVDCNISLSRCVSRFLGGRCSIEQGNLFFSAGFRQAHTSRHRKSSNGASGGPLGHAASGSRLMQPPTPNLVKAALPRPGRCGWRRAGSGA
jgi:hypothetical protein